MILKKLKLFGMIAIVASATILACKDDFTEEDFLRLQNDLAKEKEQRDSAYLEAMTQEQADSYIAALNEAGDLLSVTVLVRDDNTPVEGVSVSIASGSAEITNGRTKDVVTVVTDAGGRAVFERVTIGDNIISLSRANFVSASARVHFGTPPVPITLNTNINGTSVTRYIAPPKRFENFALPLYAESDTEGNTAVIEGTFRIENDLTNDPTIMDPIPAGLEVAANLSAALTSAGAISASCGNCVLDYRFSGSAGSLGVAAISTADGSFSMRVPATANGLVINMIYPTIVGTQRMAVRRLDGVDITPEFRQVPVRWDPSLLFAATPNIPVIPGARAVFSYDGSSTPAPAGRGFTITTFTPVARPMDVGVVSNTGNTTHSNTTYRINSRGLGYTSSPTVTINGGGGTDATAESFLRILINSVNITNGGSAYGGNDVRVQFTYIDENGDTQFYAETGDITPVGGVLPTGVVTLPAQVGFAANGPFISPNQIQGVGIRVVSSITGNPVVPGSPASIVVDRVTELGGIEITNGGSGYTSAPTITIEGGGAPVNQQASVSVSAFRTQFDFSIPTDVATTPYRVLPSDVQFVYPGNAVNGQVTEVSAKVDLINPIGNTESGNQDLIVNLRTDGTNILSLNEGYSFRTNRAWTAPPAVFVVDRTIEAALANVSISTTTGEILAIINPATDGPGLSSTTFTPNSSLTITGQGYDGISVEILPTITGAPGSGAVFNLTTTQNVNSRVVGWGGASTRLSGGSGYLVNLNRTTNAQNYSGGTSSIFVQTGKVYNLNVNAGTGVRLEAIEN
jgi:hypothetical protein